MWLKNYVYQGDRHYSPLFEHLECHIIGRQGNECGGTVLIHQSSDMNSDSLEGLHREW